MLNWSGKRFSEPSARRWALWCALTVWGRWTYKDTYAWMRAMVNNVTTAVGVYLDWRK